MNWHLDAWRKLMTQALPVGIASILTQFYVNAPIVILALLVTDASAGLYSAAHRFVFFVLMLDRVIQSLFLPIASRQYHSRQTELPKTIGTITRIALVIAVPICVLVLLLAPRIAVLLFGDDFAAAGKIMSVLIWFLPFSLISTISGYTLLAANQERRYACNTAIGVVIAIALIIAGILRLGPIGAAIGMVIGEAILAMLMLAGMLRLRRPIVSWRVFWILPALVPLAVIVLLFRNANWMLSGIGGAIGYILLIAAVRGITPAEIGFGKQQSITDDTGSSQSKEGRVNRGQKRRSD